MNNMHNSKKILFTLLVSGLIFASCRKEKDPFTGTDNYIKTFTLKKAGTTFTASFTDSTITISAPEGFSLDSAEATVALSENALMFPDPKTITAWNDEQILAVKAYNGTIKTFRYVIDRTSIATDQTVVLNTQAEVEAFGNQGFTEITGSLIIGNKYGTDSIRSLAPLYRLKKIGYSLIFYPTYAGKDVVGLDNLVSIGDGLKIEAVNTLEKFALPKLETAGGIFIKNTTEMVVKFPNLVSVSKALDITDPLLGLSLPNLTRVGGALNIYSGTNSATSLPKLSLPRLKEAGSLMFYYFINASKVELPELVKTGDINMMNLPKVSAIIAPKLQTTSGKLVIPDPSSLTEISFPSLISCGGLEMTSKKIITLDFPKLTTITGDVKVSYAAIDGIKSLGKLTTVTGEILLANLAQMPALGIPASLKSIKKLTIFYSPGAAPSEINIKGLNIGELNLQLSAPIKVIGDDIFKGTLTVNPNALTPYPELVGFTEIDSLGFNGYISYMNDVVIKGVKKITRGFWMPNNNVRTFSIPDLEEVSGNFVINHFNQLTQPVLEFPKLKKIGGDFDVQVQSTAVTTVQFTTLTSVGGNFKLGTGYSNRVLSTLLFPGLESIGNKLTIYAQTTTTGVSNKLTDLDGFTTLKNVKAVEVTGQSVLVSYIGLKNAFPSFTSNWMTAQNAYNPTYADLQAGAWVKP